MHSRLGCAARSQLAFSGENNLNFLWEKSYWNNTVVKSKVKKHFFKERKNTEARRCVSSLRKFYINDKEYKNELNESRGAFESTTVQHIWRQFVASETTLAVC